MPETPYARYLQDGEIVDGVVRVVGRLGNPSSANVLYLAEPTRGGDRVVLKTVRPDLVGPESPHVDRFRREARAWLHVSDHPNVLATRSAMSLGNSFMLLLPYLEEGSLDDCLSPDEVRTRPSFALRMAVQVCDAMEHVYSRGLLYHGDIKPENLLLNDFDHLLLSDFGLAGFRAPHESRPEVSEPLMGTVAYLAPELREGRTTERGPATDLYAFGITLVQMLFGARAEEAPSLAGRGLAQSLWGRFEGFPGRDRERWSDALALLVYRCLSPFPEGRPDGFGSVRRTLAWLLRETAGYAHPPIEAEARGLGEEVMTAFSLDELGYSRDSLDFCDRALALDSDNLHAVFLKGRALYNLGRAPQAIPYLERAVEMEPAHFDALADLGHCYLTVGDSEAGLERLARAERLGFPRGHTDAMRAVYLKQTGKPAEALESIDAALAHDRERVQWLEIKGSILSDLERYPEAVAVYRRVTELHYWDERAWMSLVRGLSLSNDPSGCLDATRQALQRWPENALLWHARAGAYLGLTVAEKGETEVETFVARCREGQECARQAERLGVPDGAGAIAVFAGMLEEMRPEIEAPFRRLIDGAKKEDWMEGLAALEEIERLLPDDPFFLTQKAIALLNLSREDEGEASLRRAIRLQPSNAGALSTLAFHLLKKPSDDPLMPLRVLRMLDRAVMMEPDRAETWVNRGVVLYGLDRLEEALESFEKAIRCDQFLAKAWRAAGEAMIFCHQEPDRWARAREYIKRALELGDEEAAESLESLPSLEESMGVLWEVAEWEA